MGTPSLLVYFSASPLILSTVQVPSRAVSLGFASLIADVHVVCLFISESCFREIVAHNKAHDIFWEDTKQASLCLVTWESSNRLLRSPEYHPLFAPAERLKKLGVSEKICW